MSGLAPLEVWDDLRRHLEWTRGAPSLTFITSQSRGGEQELAHRLDSWGARHDVPRHEFSGDGDEIADALTQCLPLTGLVVVHLPWDDERGRYRVLARLNELRARLADPRQGALVILGPEAVSREAARRAADLWSVRSLSRLVGLPAAARVGEMTVSTPSSHGADAPGRLLYADYHAIAAREVDRPAFAQLRQAARLSVTDLRAARRLAEAVLDAASVGDELRALAACASAELAGVDGDWTSLHQFLTTALDVPATVPYLRLLELVVDIGLRYGDPDVALRAADAQVAVCRDLADRVATPESLRDLSISLDNVGAVAQARGDWDSATTTYDESLTIARDLADRVATPESLRDLSVSLDNVGAVARARGDWDRATTTYDESLTLRRDLADRVATPESLRDLSVSLDNVGAVARARGDWDRATTTYDESLTLRRDLADRVATPESLRDLSVSLDNVGAVARARGDWDRATTTYDEQLAILRDLADRVATPESLRDLSVSLDNVGAVARARGDWDRATTAHEEALALARQAARADSSWTSQEWLRWLMENPPPQGGGSRSDRG
jgi:tetratricopeptide (TPR) repeat protein